MNRGNGDKRRTFSNFDKDYSEYLVQLMQMLCVPHALADIVRRPTSFPCRHNSHSLHAPHMTRRTKQEKKAEYQQCLDFARACLEKGYDVRLFAFAFAFAFLGEFTAPTLFRPGIQG